MFYRSNIPESPLPTREMKTMKIHSIQFKIDSKAVEVLLPDTVDMVQDDKVACMDEGNFLDRYDRKHLRKCAPYRFYCIVDFSPYHRSNSIHVEEISRCFDRRNIAILLQIWKTLPI